MDIEKGKNSKFISFFKFIFFVNKALLNEKAKDMAFLNEFDFPLNKSKDQY